LNECSSEKRFNEDTFNDSLLTESDISSYNNSLRKDRLSDAIDDKFL